MHEKGIASEKGIVDKFDVRAYVEKSGNVRAHVLCHDVDVGAYGFLKKEEKKLS